MQLGNFSVSLNVQDISASRDFYAALGFEALEGCGSIEEKWLIMQKETAIIGLFEGMLSENLMTFNPTDARAIERHMQEQGYEITLPTEGTEGACHFQLRDPDGNLIMFDQW